jgi:hypothetical protein
MSRRKRIYRAGESGSAEFQELLYCQARFG